MKPAASPASASPLRPSETGADDSPATPLNLEADPFADAGWANALDLGERLLSLDQQPPVDRLPPDPELATSRLARWQSRSGLDRDRELWQQRLAADRLDDQELLTLLGESPESIQQRIEEPPAWLEVLRQAYRAEDADPFPWPESAAEGCARSTFLPLVEPLVRHACRRLDAGALAIHRRFPQAPFEPTAVASAFLGHLPDLLSPLLGRTLVVELNAARLEERLVGDTPEERYLSFRRSLYRRPVALDILGAYPVLARRLVRRLRQWVDASLEVLERLSSEAEEIQRHFADTAAFDRLIEARGGVSDPHRDGRSVVLLRFASGLRLVYKPRPLAVEAAFQRLLEWFNARGFTPPFRILKVLDRGSWGLMEHVDVAPAADVQALARFFHRQGAFAALFQLLDGIDFHHENVIAAGEHPVPVDLETLFHPWVEVRSLHRVDEQPGAVLEESALRTGLLPHRLWGNQEQAGVDISGLGAQEGQLTPQAYISLQRRDTDEMRYERQQLEIPIAENRPALQDGEVSFLDHTVDLEAGFVSLHRFVRQHREALLAIPGPLQAFADVETRVLLRPTAGYGQLLHESAHPHLLANALECQFLFDRLWLEVPRRPYLASLIDAEMQDFARGDIPCFSTRPGSRHLWTSRGDRLPNFFEVSPLKRVRRRIRDLGDQDLRRQLSAVRATLDVVRLSDRHAERPSYPFQERSTPATPEELLTATREIGDRLVATAFESSVDALWLYVDHGEPEGWRVGVSGPDLYLGLPGIALFLGYLGDVTGEAKYTETARRALQSQAHQLREQPQRVVGIGAWNGWGGLIYAAIHLSRLWNDPSLLDDAESYLEQVSNQVEGDEMLDVIAGSAGLILVLLHLARHRPSVLLGRTLYAAGERLLTQAQPQTNGGLGWVMPLAGDRPLAGLSHGAAGIALALLRLTAATGDERYRQAALGGIAYERSLFDADERNWPDLRVDEEAQESIDSATERFLCAWCHGAPGIGLARLAGLDLLDDNHVRSELEIAIYTTIQKGFGHNHSLCHGDLGNLDFLLEAARSFQEDELLGRVGQLAGGILDGLRDHGRVFGLAGNVETPSLMLGLSGIGYGLLRLAIPERIPCLLALEPPVEDHPSDRRRPTLPTDVLQPWAGRRGDPTPA